MTLPTIERQRGSRPFEMTPGKFPVVGFVKDLSGVAALYLGKKEGNELVARLAAS